MAPGLELAETKKRIILCMIALACPGTLVSLFAGGRATGLAFALGSAAAVLNYAWLHEAAESLTTVPPPRVRVGLLIKFSMRYPLAFALLYAAYWTGWFPLGGLLAGLLVEVAALLAEAGYQVWAGLRRADVAG